MDRSSCHKSPRCVGTSTCPISPRCVDTQLVNDALTYRNYDYIKQLPVEYEGHLLGYQDVRLILVGDKVLLATFALRRTDDAVAEQLKAHLRRLGLKLGLLANFYGTRLAMTPVRVK